ncbi:MAG: Ubiquinone/menaquinone biosynthesis C-methylase UbiE/MenG [Candidatus Alkanophagales archaeon MCA70_species_2]|nr:Ubiquinone/menaquinone biosynthesis C-methylase UbiE/MenG [Candidatus Alkanophaga liquidiphilum]
MVLTARFDVLGIESGDVVLDAGCGDGRHTWTSCKERKCRMCALDISKEDLLKTRYVLALLRAQGELRGEAHVLMADVSTLPFKEGAFHKIICTEVLEHVEDDERVMQELVRVLKPGGKIAVSVPTYFTEKVFWNISPKYARTPGGHIRIYRIQRLLRMIKRSGLRIYEIRFEHALHSIYWLLICVCGMNVDATLPRLYRKLLLSTPSKFITTFEKVFNFAFPKSVVVYAEKPRRQLHR